MKPFGKPVRTGQRLRTAFLCGIGFFCLGAAFPSLPAVNIPVNFPSLSHKFSARDSSQIFPRKKTLSQAENLLNESWHIHRAISTSS
ncbi:MAG: hypothetical protein HYZ83_07670 [Candidatus Omnitrophica bacterium]|nr:hypothetical protein [Candidatus Omnitrophota bacterium]